MSRGEENNRITEVSKVKNATLTGNTNELTEFERAVLNKYIRELQETAGEGSTGQANDQGDDSVRDNRLRTIGGVELDENANPLAGVATPETDDRSQLPGQTSEGEQVVRAGEDLSVTTPAANPQVVTYADASTVSSTGTTSSTSNSSNNCTTTTALTISNCSNIIAANNSIECIGYQSKGDEKRSAKTNDPMEGDANTNDHNSGAPFLSCCSNTTTTTNEHGRAEAGSSANLASASSTVTMVAPPTAATSAGGDTTVARETMAANRSRAMRRNFSVWVGVTSCVWGLLLYLIKTYT
uniref:Uncharacterized protein n=1 Tax=Anopheles christyi TaxID=43041 RepID=A0A182KIU4_9DIPT